MDELTRLARAEILTLRAYSSARTEGPQSKLFVHLDANENPFLPHPGDESTIGLNQYPHQQPDDLLGLFAEMYGRPRSQLLITRGADEAIDLLVRCFCRAEVDGIITHPPTFAMYSMSAKIQNVVPCEVPLMREVGTFSLDVQGIINEHKAKPTRKLVFLCSPNNPTGGLLNSEDVLRLSATLFGKAIVVVDETYVEFSGQPSIALAAKDHPNIVVLRTLSKEYSLAGERCGITIAHPSVIDLLRKILAPYPIAQSSSRAILAALSTPGREQARRNITLIVQERNRLAAAFEASPAVMHVYPSNANFLLLEVDQPTRLSELMAAHGIKIRNLSTEAGLDRCVRISIGTAEQNSRMLGVLGMHAEER